MRVLLIAEAANPEMVSVPLEGWSNASALAKVTDAHLVTQVRNREAIARAGLVEGKDFTAIDSEAIARPLHAVGQKLRGGAGKGWTTLAALGAFTYPYFERLVWRQFGGRIIAGEFDLVHRITPLSPTHPSPIARRCRDAGVPFLLGPMNGGLAWPAGFDRVRREEKEWLSYARSLHKLIPGHGAMWRDASAILVGSRSTWDEIPSRYNDKKFYIPENAIDSDRFAETRTRRADRPVRAVFVGRLVPYKGADMLLEAAAPILRSGGMTLDLIGDGPQMPGLREFVNREGLGESVRFRGWVEHRDLAAILAESDLLTFPSIREFGGGVVVEAMAVGVVPVVVAYGGPGELATEVTGYLLPLGSREEIVQKLADLLGRITADPSQIEAKSQAARRRIQRYFTWTAKADQIVDVYRWVLGQSTEKPDLGMPVPDESAVAIGEAIPGAG